MKSIKFSILIVVILLIGKFASSVDAEVCRCGRIYSPVCVQDGEENKTFSNECVFECEQQERGRNGHKMIFKHDGPCRLDNEM